MFRIGKGSKTPARPPSESSEEHEDLLAQCEEAEFAASVLAARNRASGQKLKLLESTSQEIESEDEIQWTEQEDVYRPDRIDAQAYLSSLMLAPMPRLKRGESLVLIRSAAIEIAQGHLRTDMRIELGGLLAGQALYDPALDLYIIIVEAALPALNGVGTSTTFSYTPASWQALLPQLQQMQPTWTIVGSYHSHPGLGVFLSSTDRQTQADVFPHDWQIALVIDPAADTAGYFVGLSGKPCQAFVLEPGDKKMPSETR